MGGIEDHEDPSPFLDEVGKILNDVDTSDGGNGDNPSEQDPTQTLFLTENAKKVLRKRYLRKNEDGIVIETPEEMFRRVARTVARAELLYDIEAPAEELEEVFYSMMSNLEFLPNSPTLMNAGRELGQLSGCFVIPIHDSMDSIFEAIKNAAKPTTHAQIRLLSRSSIVFFKRLCLIINSIDNHCKYLS